MRTVDESLEIQIPRDPATCSRGTRAGFESVVCTASGHDSRIELLPARGGIVTSVRIHGRELLYMDEATLADTTKNVRGGIPILFPIAGKLPGGRATFDGMAFEFAQHGFARNLAWSVAEESDRIGIELVSSDATRKLYPYEFRLRVYYYITGRSLCCTLELHNCGDRPMPAHMGFHPYFLVPDSRKAEIRVEAIATKAFDNKSGVSADYSPPSLAVDELDYHILDPTGGAVRLSGPDPASFLRLDYGGFPTVVLWTLRGRDFVCMEPWSAPAGALATGAGLVVLKPHDSVRRMWFVQGA